MLSGDKESVILTFLLKHRINHRANYDEYEHTVRVGGARSNSSLLHLALHYATIVQYPLLAPGYRVPTRYSYLVYKLFFLILSSVQ